MEEKILADLLMGFGSLIGLTVKWLGLRDSDTVWPRSSSGLNILTYPVTAIYPMWILELYLSLTVAFASLCMWIGIFIWRSPENDPFSNLQYKLSNIEALK